MSGYDPDAVQYELAKQRDEAITALTDAQERIAVLEAERDKYRLAYESAEWHLTERGKVVDALKAQLVEQRVLGHGEGQEHTIADVNAGKVDDLIRPRLDALLLQRAQEIVELLSAISEAGIVEEHGKLRWVFTPGTASTRLRNLSLQTKYLIEDMARRHEVELTARAQEIEHLKDRLVQATLATLVGAQEIAQVKALASDWRERALVDGRESARRERDSLDATVYQVEAQTLLACVVELKCILADAALVSRAPQTCQCEVYQSCAVCRKDSK